MPESLSPNGRTLAGHCLCGSVRYRVADAFAYAANCHCSDCRRATGAAFKSFAGIARSCLQVTAGVGFLRIYDGEDCNMLDGTAASDNRADGIALLARTSGDLHCGRCGSLLFSIVRDGAFVHVAMGSLSDAPSLKPSMHIFTGSKAPWFTITDSLPQFEGHAGQD